MYKDLKFPILIVHRDIKADTVAGDRVRGIAQELEQEGFSIFSAVDYAEGRLVASTHHGLACMLIAAEGAGENTHLLQNMVELIRLARLRAPNLPIFALGEQVTLENAPADAMSELNQLRSVRPMVWVFEIPWHEMDVDDELKLRCEPAKTRLTTFDEGFTFIGVWFQGDSYEYEYHNKRIEVHGNRVDYLFSRYGPDY
jgi:hypothetical protein